MKRIFLCLTMFLFVATIFAADPVAVVFSVEPKMSCQNCEKKIKTNIRFEKGVKDIATSLEAQTVTVKFDPAKTSKEKIAKAFDKIGYKATEVKGSKPVKADCSATCGQGGCCEKNKDKKSPCRHSK